MGKPWIKFALGSVISVGFIAGVQYVIGWAALLAPWYTLSWQAVVGALLATGFTYVLRTWRLLDYFRDTLHGAFWPCLKITLQHNLLNNFLPMRAGELSFPWLMARHFHFPLWRSLPALVWFRFLDLHVLTCVALIGVAAPLWGGWTTSLLLILWLPLPWLVYHYAARRGEQNRAEAAPGQPRHPYIERAMDMWRRARQSLPTEPAAFWRSWGWTVINWVVKLALFAWVLQLFVELPVSAAWLGAVAGDLTSVLPIHGLAGMGTYEAGVVAALLPYGIDAQSALRGAVNLHLFLLGATVLGGAVSVLIPEKKRG